MIQGQLFVCKAPLQVQERLRLLFAAANCQILENNGSRIRFRHGTYLTGTASLLPKMGEVNLEATPDGGTRICYRIGVAPFVTVWMTLVALVFCWAVFPPILVYRALRVHPRRLMENLLAGI